MRYPIRKKLAKDRVLEAAMWHLPIAILIFQSDLTLLLSSWVTWVTWVTCYSQPHFLKYTSNWFIRVFLCYLLRVLCVLTWPSHPFHPRSHRCILPEVSRKIIFLEGAWRLLESFLCSIIDYAWNIALLRDYFLNHPSK